ncbi:FUSC family protein [uncultured Corynebacterium sp.]|uniref:FUSC family protein n=1 Tax=uncultured Corynebacterium sp. TaxID=159447 RepID=UPI0025FE6F5A|nr:FUSC family protein [uncultured Corynebacterium sp.]
MSDADATMRSDWSRIWRLGPPVMPVADRLRLGMPTILILVVGALMGRYLDALLVGLGTYTVLFGGIPGRRHRAIVMAAGGVGLVAAVSAGVAVAGSLPWTLVAFVGASLLAVVLDSAVRLGPPGPYFFTLMVGGGGIIGIAGFTVADVVPQLAAGAVVAFVAAVAGADRPEPTAGDGEGTESLDDGPASTSSRVFSDVLARLTWPHPDSVTFVRVVVATLVTFAALTLANDSHPFWAVLVVVLVLSYPGDQGTLMLRTFHRVVGTAIGFFAFWAWTLVAPPAWVAFVAIGVLLWITMGLAPRNYGYACVAITLLALLMTQALMPDAPPGQLATARVIDTVVGAVVAIGCMLLIRPWGRVRA